MLKLSTNISLSAARLRRTHQRLLMLDATYKKIGVLVFQFIQRQFQTSGAYGGTFPWPPLKESTLRAKRRERYSSMPLIRTGDLKQKWGIELGRNRVTVRSHVGYSGYHQHGTRHLPARPMLPDERQALELAARTIKGDVGKAIAETLRVPVR